MSPRASTTRLAVLVAFGLSGAAALAYEVIWTRALSVVLGSATHAISSMLATFMLGLAVGGFAGGRLADKRERPLALAAWCEFGIAALGIATLFLIRALPGVYLAIYRAAHLQEAAFFALQIGLCSAVMLGPTILMGMTFPLVTRALADGATGLGRAVGHAYGANTLGSVAGSLLAGFLLVPLLGLRGSALAAATANLCVALIFLWASSNLRPARAAAFALLLAALGGLTSLLPQDMTMVSFYTASRYLDADHVDVVREERARMRPLSIDEGRDGRVTAFRVEDRLMLQVGGKIEGTGAKDVPNTLLLAYLPVAAHGRTKRMLVVGLGAGVTLGAARRAAPDVELAEINEGVLRAVRAHGPPGLLDGIRIHRDDARNLLLRTEERYDVISSEPSYPTDFSVANLFSREYFELAAGRLTPGGVYCQWLPYYMLTNDDVTMVVKTFASVFRHTSIWKVPDAMDLILIGSSEPLQSDEATVRRRVAELNAGGPTLDFQLSRTPAQVAELIADPTIPVNTDDRPILEFRVARNLRVGDLSLLESSARPEGAGSLPGGVSAPAP